MEPNPYSTSGNASPGYEEKLNSRKKIIKRFSPLQLGKMLCVLYGIISLIFTPIFILGALFSPNKSGMGMSIGLMVLIPIFYAIAGLLTGIIGGWIYNIVTKIVGGIEIEVE